MNRYFLFVKLDGVLTQIGTFSGYMDKAAAVADAKRKTNLQSGYAEVVVMEYVIKTFATDTDSVGVIKPLFGVSHA